jgi:cation diffusion facilitator family transporter
LSFALATVVLALKGGAFALTGSVALLSDAAESLVNVLAAVMVLAAVRVARLPPDYRHPYGHHKVEYLSSALEGGLILLAAGAILASAVPRLLEPQPLENPLAGTLVAVAATALNGGGALLVGRVARRSGSAALAANARHLWTDVWTSVGVVLGVLLVTLTGWLRLDPVIAALVALNIVREGWMVVRGSFSSLLDVRLPDEEERLILEVLDAYPQVLGYHRLRSRRSGSGRFAEVDVFVPPEMTVGEAHELVSGLEARLKKRLPGLVTTIHIEPFIAGVREGARSPREEFRAPPRRG